MPLGTSTTTFPCWLNPHSPMLSIGAAGLVLTDWLADLFLLLLVLEKFDRYIPRPSMHESMLSVQSYDSCPVWFSFGRGRACHCRLPARSTDRPQTCTHDSTHGWFFFFTSEHAEAKRNGTQQCRHATRTSTTWPALHCSGKWTRHSQCGITNRSRLNARRCRMVASFTQVE